MGSGQRWGGLPGLLQGRPGTWGKRSSGGCPGIFSLRPPVSSLARVWKRRPMLSSSKIATRPATGLHTRAGLRKLLDARAGLLRLVGGGLGGIEELREAYQVWYELGRHYLRVLAPDRVGEFEELYFGRAGGGDSGFSQYGGGLLARPPRTARPLRQASVSDVYSSHECHSAPGIDPGCPRGAL